MTTTYTLQRRVAPSEVTRDVVEQIEDRILAAAKLLSGDDFNPQRDFHVEIKDRIGTQRLGSIRGYPSPTFPNGTESLLLRYWDLPILITIAFSLSRDSSNIDLTIPG